MNSRHRGFTLIEILIVIGILVIVTGSFLAMYAGMYGQLHSVARQADVKSDSQRTAAVLFGRLAASPDVRLEPDNHGVRFADGSRVYWDGRSVLHQADGRISTVSAHPVTDFNLVHSRGIWTLNLVLRDGGHDYRCVADWPRLTDLEGGQRL